METTSQTKKIRDLMPERFTRLIIAEAPRATTSAISEAVGNERINSKLWPHIERLAKQTDPEAYEQRMEFLRQRFEAAA